MGQKLQISYSVAFCVIYLAHSEVFSFSLMGSQSENHPRPVRSPQFSFPGRNVLSDLAQQIRPPSLDDFNEFRQRMANLANFTALLEQGLAAERAARNTLQSFVTSVREQVTGIQTAVNPDPGTYWLESKECGGILVSQTGRISYKKNKYYRDHERCAWTVRANYRSKIKITLTSAGLEENHDFVEVSELPEDVDGRKVLTTKRISTGETSIFNGPLIFITFVSDGSIRKTGFQLDFEGLGSNVRTTTIYHHFHFTDWMGQFDSANLSQSLAEEGTQLGDGNTLMATFVVNPSYWNYSTLELLVPENELDLRPEECEKTSLTIFEDFIFAETGRSHRCCGTKCEKDKFETSARLLFALFSSSDLSEGNEFQMNWSTDTSKETVLSADTCGGVLKGDLGKITYKVKRIYDNNERCVWIISGEKMGRSEIKLQLLKDGFEHHYDFITLAYFEVTEGSLSDSISIINMFQSSQPIIVPAPFVIVEFYSDAANLGKTSGFDLIWEIKYKTELPLSADFDLLWEQSGSKEITCIQDASKNEHHYKVVVINANGKSKGDESENDGSMSTPVELTITDQSRSTVFASESGNFSQTAKSDSGSYLSVDGVFLVLAKCDAEMNTEVLTWKSEIGTTASFDSGDETSKPVKSVDQCGEVLFGDSGVISYKLGKEYNLNERCTWLVRAKSSKSVSFRLMSDGFESCCDGIQINRVDTSKGLIETDPVFINRENRFQTVDGPVFLITFFSDHSLAGTGFKLEFQTKGKPVEKDMLINHWHVHLDTTPTPEEPFGPVFIQLADNSMTLDTFHFAVGNDTEMKVVLAMDNFQTIECDQDSVALYHMPEITKYQLLKQFPEQCGMEISSSRAFRQEIIPFKGVLLVVSKVQKAEETKSLSVAFKI